MSDLGFDHGINYKTENVEDQLRYFCPEGIDVYFDNVAGPILDNIAVHGRVALSGMMENYNKEEPVPGPYQFDMLLMRRATITGFLSRDFPPYGRIRQPDAQMDRPRTNLTEV